MNKRRIVPPSSKQAYEQAKKDGTIKSHDELTLALLAENDGSTTKEIAGENYWLLHTIRRALPRLEKPKEGEPKRVRSVREKKEEIRWFLVKGDENG